MVGDRLLDRFEHLPQIHVLDDFLLLGFKSFDDDEHAEVRAL